MRPLLIGQAPGPKSDPDMPLAPFPRTSAGGRLAEFAGLTPEGYLDMFDRTNLLHTFPGRTKRDDKWPARRAEIAASAMKPLLGGRTLILVGRNVAEAFGYPAQHLDFHQWFFDPNRWFRIRREGRIGIGNPRTWNPPRITGRAFVVNSLVNKLF